MTDPPFQFANSDSTSGSAPPPATPRCTGESARFSLGDFVAPGFAEATGFGTESLMLADAEQRIVWLSGAAEKMFGRTAAELTGQPVRNILAEGLIDDRPAPQLRLALPSTEVRQTLRSVTRTGVRSDGHRLAIEAAVVQLEVGAISLVVALLRDTADQQQGSDFLRRSETTLPELLAEAPIGLMWVARDGKVEHVNAAQLQLLDRPVDQVVGKSVVDLHIDREGIESVLARLTRGEKVHNVHVRSATEHTLVHLLVDANGVWKDGMLVQSQWYVRDITSRTLLESELLSLAETERQRIGQDLHDDLCQQLVAVEFMTGALAKRLEGRVPDLVQDAHGISDHLRAAVDRAREISQGLAPSVPKQPDGLMTVLRDLAEHTERVFGRRCRFDCPKPVLVADRAATLHLFRIAQEAVANAVRHGQARNIVIKLVVNSPHLVLAVSDDGNGEKPEPGKRRGMGLRVMQYRAGAIGGTLAIQRDPGLGTSVVCTVKLGTGAGGARA